VKMEALKAEIAARKQRANELKEQTNGGKRKFVRRGELAALQQREIEEKRQAFEDGFEARRQQSIQDRSGNGAAELTELLTKRHKFTNDGKFIRSTSETNDDHQENGDLPLSIDEVKQRLRAMGQPVTYFGESDRERYNRMRKIEEEGVDDDFAISGGFNTRNVFLDQDSRNGQNNNNDDDDDDDDDEDTPKSSKTKSYRNGFQQENNDNFEGQNGEGGGRQESDVEDEPMTLKQSSNRINDQGNALEIVRSAQEQAEDKDPHRAVREYFRGLLRDWEEALNARPDHVKRTAQGKIETKTQKQCKDYIRPLFKLCKKRDVPSDILESLLLITRCCREGEFVKANDAYIVTAIGKAAWPIGVTSVGIHGRSAHDKVQTGQVAHVMNNEMQRKYLQSVKRLIKFEQTRRVDVAPSKKVL